MKGETFQPELAAAFFVVVPPAFLTVALTVVAVALTVALVVVAAEPDTALTVVVLVAEAVVLAGLVVVGA